MRFTNLATSAVLGGFLAFGSGCSDAPAPVKPVEPKTAAQPATEKEHEHEHGHAEHGPHGGQLVELGNEEYHAELIHDEEGGTITIYLLDGEAKRSVSVEASEVVINLKHGGKGEQFKVAASPQDADPQGKASRFVSNDKELGEDLDHEGAEARLVVEIDGKSYTGKIEHEHDAEHGDHEHKDKN